MPSPRSPHVETRDVDPRRLLFFAGALAGSLVAVLLVLRLAFDAFPPPVPFGADTGILSASVPVLQPAPRSDRAAYEAEKQKELQSTGWVDRAAGVARIPIGEAMKLVAERGVPDWGQNAPSPAGDCAILAKDVPRAPQVSRCRQAAPSAGGAE